ncbi:hypothetical protein BJ170DRAFT_710252 [Xylariales sp. AK1849]|nr:hypothetical protein BJ170DRAFT_710252 [Xylariales sp. AK1849]
MKTASVLLVAAAFMQSALAAKPKLNQYASLDDCKNDKNILYHAAPVTGRCYDFDDKTHAWFSNAGGRWYTAAYTEKGCKGTKQGICSVGNCGGFPLPDGTCLDKGIYKSYKAA